MAIFYEKARKSRHFRPSDGIQSIMAKKQNPEILGCAPLRGGTHSILAYSLPVLSRKIVEYVSSLFFLLFSSPSGVFLSWRAEPILSWQKGGTKKILNSRGFYHPWVGPNSPKNKTPLVCFDGFQTRFVWFGWFQERFVILITVIPRSGLREGEGRNYVHNLAQHVT